MIDGGDFSSRAQPFYLWVLGHNAARSCDERESARELQPCRVAELHVFVPFDSFWILSRDICTLTTVPTDARGYV